MKATILFALTLIVTILADPCAPQTEVITNDNELNAASSCSSTLIVSSITGTTLPISFPNVKALRNPLIIQNTLSPNISFPALTSYSGITIQSNTNLFSVVFGSNSSQTATPSINGITLQNNTVTGGALTATFYGANQQQLNFINNPQLTTLSYISLSGGAGGALTLTNNSALTAASFSGLTSLQSLAINMNAVLATLSFPLTPLTGFQNTGAVSLTGNDLTGTVLLPVNGVTGAFTVQDNTGSFNLVVPNAIAFNSGASLSVSNNVGLGTFTLQPTGTLSSVLYSNNNAGTLFNLRAPVTDQPTTPAFSISAALTLTGSAATDYYIDAINIDSVNVVNGKNVVIAFTGTTKTIQVSGAVTTLLLGSTAATSVSTGGITVSATGLNSAALGFYQITGGLSINKATGNSATFNTTVTIIDSFTLQSTNGFASVNLIGLRSVGINALGGGQNPNIFVSNNVFASGASFTTSGNYAVNGAVNINSNPPSGASATNTASYNLNGLTAVNGGIYILNNGFTNFVSSVVCVPNITLNSNQGYNSAEVRFPNLSNLASRIITDGSNQFTFSIGAQTGTSGGNSCINCNPGDTGCASSGFQSSGICNTSCPFNPLAPFVNPATTTSSTSYSPTTSSLSSSSVTTSSVTTSFFTTSSVSGGSAATTTSTPRSNEASGVIFMITLVVVAVAALL